MKKRTDRSKPRPRRSNDELRINGDKGQNGSFVYYRSNSPRRDDGRRRITKLESTRDDKNSRRRSLIYIVIALLAIILLELPVSSTPNIAIKSSNNSAVNQNVDQYKKAIEHILNQSFYNRTKLTLNKASLVSKLKEQFPNISEADVSYSMFSYHPTISLQLAPPAIILGTASGNYLLSADGAVIALVNEKNKAKLPAVEDKSLQKATPGEPVLPASYIKFITEVISQLGANNIRAKSLIMPSGRAELDLVANGTDYTVKFNLEGDSRQQAGTYIAAKNYLSKHNKTPRHYLNVMVPGKAYYK